MFSITISKNFLCLRDDSNLNLTVLDQVYS